MTVTVLVAISFTTGASMSGRPSQWSNLTMASEPARRPNCAADWRVEVVVLLKPFRQRSARQPPGSASAPFTSIYSSISLSPSPYIHATRTATVTANAPAFPHPSSPESPRPSYPAPAPPTAFTYVGTHVLVTAVVPPPLALPSRSLTAAATTTPAGEQFEVGRRAPVWTYPTQPSQAPLEFP